MQKVGCGGKSQEWAVGGPYLQSPGFTGTLDYDHYQKTPLDVNVKIDNDEKINNKGPSWAKVTDTDGIVILYTNADCLTNKLNELKILITSLTLKPAIIAITEHRWHSNINEL